MARAQIDIRLADEKWATLAELIRSTMPQFPLTDVVKLYAVNERIVAIENLCANLGEPEFGPVPERVLTLTIELAQVLRLEEHWWKPLQSS